MRNWNTLVCLLVVAIASVASAEDASIKILKETKIFALDKSREIFENSGLHSMRISPDGKRLLYVQRLPGDANRAIGGYQLVLRDIETGKDTILPGAACDSDDFLVAYVSMCPFDATGKKIILPVCESDNDGPMGLGEGQMKLGIYDIAAGTLKELDMTAPMIFPSYDASGKNIIVLKVFANDHGPDLELSKLLVSPSNKIKFRTIGIMGMPRTPCPTGDILPILLPPNRKNPGGPRESDLIVYDMKANGKIASPPLLSSSYLEGYNPQWTGDGRYLYYVDEQEDRTPERHSRGHKRLMRVWDREKLVEKSVTEGLAPIGPAPGKAGMIVGEEKKLSYSVHNPASGKTTPILDGKTKIINITGRFMVCVKEDPDGKKTVYRTEIK